MAYLFVGEKRSNRAIKLGITWRTGGLAAKPLHEALRASGLNPDKCNFTNIFEKGGKTTVEEFKGIIVGMGKKVQTRLSTLNIDHIPIVHPAARGKIRKRERYIKHVKEQLFPLTF
jgi:hypothetical protein